MKSFTKALKKLHFKYIPQEGCDAWSKVYKGFILFIAKAPNGELLASITVGKLEIRLPNIPDESWVIEFDEKNTKINAVSLSPPMNSGQDLDLDEEWKKFLTKVNPEKWSSSEETCYYLAFCTGWWARTGEASFQNDH